MWLFENSIVCQVCLMPFIFEWFAVTGPTSVGLVAVFARTEGVSALGLLIISIWTVLFGEFDPGSG